VRPASIASIQLVRVAVPEWLTDDELSDGEGEARAAFD
jgi:hypothetical protein